MYGSGLNGIFTGMIVFFTVVGFVIGGLVFWLLPLLWEWIKPLLHAVTA